MADGEQTLRERPSLRCRWLAAPGNWLLLSTHLPPPACSGQTRWRMLADRLMLILATKASLLSESTD